MTMQKSLETYLMILVFAFMFSSKNSFLHILSSRK